MDHFAPFAILGMAQGGNTSPALIHILFEVQMFVHQSECDLFMYYGLADIISTFNEVYITQTFTVLCIFSHVLIGNPNDRPKRTAQSIPCI